MPTISFGGRVHDIHVFGDNHYHVLGLSKCPRCDTPSPVYAYQWDHSDMRAKCCHLQLGQFRYDGQQTRYAIVHESDKGYNTLTLGNCGDIHYATKEEAEAALAAFKEGLRRVLSDKEWQTLTVRAVECYHYGEAISTVF